MAATTSGVVWPTRQERRPAARGGPVGSSPTRGAVSGRRRPPAVRPRATVASRTALGSGVGEGRRVTAIVRAGASPPLSGAVGPTGLAGRVATRGPSRVKAVAVTPVAAATGVGPCGVTATQLRHAFTRGRGGAAASRGRSLASDAGPPAPHRGQYYARRVGRPSCRRPRRGRISK